MKTNDRTLEVVKIAKQLGVKIEFSIEPVLDFGIETVHICSITPKPSDQPYYMTLSYASPDIAMWVAIQAVRRTCSRFKLPAKDPLLKFITELDRYKIEQKTPATTAVSVRRI